MIGEMEKSQRKTRNSNRESNKNSKIEIHSSNFQLKVYWIKTQQIGNFRPKGHEFQDISIEIIQCEVQRE